MSEDAIKLANALERSTSTQSVGRTKLEKLATIAILHEQIARKMASQRLSLRHEDKEQP